MKIVLIHGQNHKGSTYQIGRMLAEKLGDENELTEFFLPRDLNHFCLGCYQCITEEEKCPFYAEKQPILAAMEEAELYIFTTPNYCLAPSASMKAFLDMMFDYWMVHRPRAWMFRKRAVVISTSAGASCRGAIKGVKQSLFYWGVPEVRSYGIAVQAMNWAGVSEKKKAKIACDMENLARKSRGAKAPRVRVQTKLIFSVMRRMQMAGWGSSPVEGEYWRRMGWCEKARPWTREA